MSGRKARFWLAAILTAASGAALGAVLEAPPAAKSAPQPPPVQQTKIVKYSASVDAPQASAELIDLLRRTSNLIALVDQPPETLGGLERRAAADKARLDAALRSEGRYAATVDAATTQNPDGSATVRIVVDPGPLYVFAPATGVTFADEKGLPDDLAQAARRELILPPGKPARAAVVKEGQDDALRRLKAAGYPFAAIDRQVIVDHDRRTMEATFLIAPGPAARFGRTVAAGDSGVAPDLILGRVPWREGDRYRPDLLDKARKDVAGLGAFDAVAVVPDLKLENGDAVPVTVRTEPRLRRYLGASALYSSDEGAGVRAWWGHRNLFGRAERLRVDLAAARLGMTTVSSGGLGKTDFTLGALFEAPDFLARGQDLRIGVRAISENPAAYDRKGQTASIGLERRYSDRFTARATVEQDASFVKTNSGDYHVSLIGPAATATWDYSNNPLDPTAGYRLTAELAAWQPFAGDGATSFVVGSVEGRAYHDFVGDGGAVLAGRLNLSSVAARRLADVPPHRRLYAGGGASVRGYALQMAGPRDATGDPTGGLSRIDGGVELRAKVMENIAVVPFLDAAMVSEQSLGAATAGDLRAGGGLGLRYHTDFGPLRADLAFPFKRESNDSLFQLYISFGQAF